MQCTAQKLTTTLKMASCTDLD